MLCIEFVDITRPGYCGLQLVLQAGDNEIFVPYVGSTQASAMVRIAEMAGLTRTEEVIELPGAETQTFTTLV